MIFAMASFALTTLSSFAADAPPAESKDTIHCEQRHQRQPADTSDLRERARELRESRIHD